MKELDPIEAVQVRNMSRRVVLKMAGGALITATLFPLAGCGGSGGSGTGGPGGPASVRVNLLLPAGVKGANLSLLTGYGSTKGLGSSATAIVQSQNLTAAMIVETATGKTVMVGLVDSTGGANTLDATNVAATLIYYKIGGAQTARSNRTALWKLVLKDPATKVFATLVKSRLSANAFALANRDSQILSGLATAVSRLSSTTLSGVNPSAGAKGRSSAPPTRASLPPPPSPDVKLSVKNPIRSEVDSSKFALYSPEAPDYVAAKSFDLIEHTCFVFDRSRTKDDDSVVNADPGTLLFGPVSLDPGSGPENTVSGPPMPVGLVADTDKLRTVLGVALAPVFDSPAMQDVEGMLSGQFSQFNKMLPPMWKRAAVQFCNLIILEALGRPVTFATISQLDSEIASLSASSSATYGALVTAGQGADLQGTVNGLLAAIFASPQSETAALNALANIAGIELGPITSTLAENYYALHTWLMLYVDTTANRSSLVYGLEYRSLDGGPLTMDAQEILCRPMEFDIEASPGNTMTPKVPIQLEITNNGEGNPKRRYNWKLKSPVQGVLSDGRGHQGVTIQTDSDKVTFTPAKEITDNQTVTCDVDNLESSTPVLAGTGEITLLNAGFKVTISPANANMSYDDTQAFTATLTQPSGSHVTPIYKWSFASYGELTDPISGKTIHATDGPIETASKTVSYKAPKTDPGGGQTTSTLNTIYLSVLDQNKKVLCTAKDNITLTAKTDLTPHNPTVGSDSSTVFKVSTPNGNYPAGTKFEWTLTGNGSIGSSKSVTTTTPQITYEAPFNDSTATLAVLVKDSSDAKIGAATTTITSRANYSISMVDTRGSFGTVSGPQVMYNTTTSKPAVPSFGSDNIITINWGTNVITGVTMLIHRAPGTKFKAGQVIVEGADGPPGHGYGYTPAAGQFFYFSISFFSGKMTITKVTDNPDKTTTVSFTITMKSPEFDFSSGSGTMLIAPDGTDGLPPY